PLPLAQRAPPAAPNVRQRPTCELVHSAYAVPSVPVITTVATRGSGPGRGRRPFAGRACPVGLCRRLNDLRDTPSPATWGSQRKLGACSDEAAPARTRGQARTPPTAPMPRPVLTPTSPGRTP